MKTVRRNITFDSYGRDRRVHERDGDRDGDGDRDRPERDGDRDVKGNVPLMVIFCPAVTVTLVLITDRVTFTG